MNEALLELDSKLELYKKALEFQIITMKELLDRPINSKTIIAMQSCLYDVTVLKTSIDLMESDREVFNGRK